MVNVSAAHTRTFNKFGSEVLPSDIKKDTATKVTNDKLMQSLGDTTAAPKALGLGSDVLSLIHPATPGNFLFWVDTDKVKNMNLKDGEEVLIRTHGDSIFAEKFARADMDAFEGMEHGKLLSQVSSRTDHHADGDKPLPGDENQGVDEDEWD